MRDIKREHEIRTLALLHAVRLYGSEEALSILIKVERSVISKWINIPTRKIPYKKALLIEKRTEIDIERILTGEDDKEIIEYLKERGAANKLMLRDILINNILIIDPPLLLYETPDRPIIIGTDSMLISGLAKLKTYKKSAVNKIKVLILDLESLLLGIKTMEDLNTKLLISERIAVGLRLKQLLGNRQGERNDLGSRPSKNQINSNNHPLPSSICYKVTGRTEDQIAKIIGFASKDTYIRAKQVCLYGSQELILALDHKLISITKATTIAKLPKDQQHQTILKQEKNYVQNKNSKTGVI